MPQKSHIENYEPVTRSSMPKPVDETNRDDSSGASLSNPNSLSADVDRTPPREKSESSTAAKSEYYRNSMLKRGHAVSFVGLFLFTVVVYFRPYELFSWLSWATSMAFWIAILTLIVYVPTQLGLDGNLTTRPREINLIILLVLTGILSIPMALDKATAFYGFTEFLKVVLMFIVMVNVTRTEKRLKALILLALFISCIVSASAVNDYRLGRLLLLGRNERIQGLIGNLFENPNDLALHLVTMIPLAMALLFASRGGIKKLLFGSCVVLMTAGVVATFSRGGFVGLVSVGAALAWRLAKSNKLLIATCLPIALLLFILLAPGGYGTRLATTADSSGVARRDDLKRSLFVTIHHPLFGIGINNYVIYSDVNHATHNAYTQVASEMGLPAMVIYILFLITPLKHLRRIGRETYEARRTSRFHYMAVGLEASLVGYMVSSFFLSVAYVWYLYYIVGYAICFRRLYDAVQNKGSGTLATPSKRNTKKSR